MSAEQRLARSFPIYPDYGSSRESVSLYGIAGWYTQAQNYTTGNHDNSFSFGGTFSRDNQTGQLYGQLSDRDGMSFIIGQLSDTRMHFEKYYLIDGVSRGEPVEYNLERSEDYWVGSYDHLTEAHGGVKCKVTLVHPDAGGMWIGPWLRRGKMPAILLPKRYDYYP